MHSASIVLIQEMHLLNQQTNTEQRTPIVFYEFYALTPIHCVFDKSC